MWRNQMSSKTRHVAIAVFGLGLAICSFTPSMAAKAKMKSNLHLAEMMCGSTALEKLDENAKQARIEECSSQTPVLDSGTLIAPIPTIVAARKKGPKERDKTDHQRAACPPQTTSPDALTAKRRREGPKGDVDHGCTDSNPTPDVPALKRKGPKGAGSSDAQG
jgi:hypothetical protein